MKKISSTILITAFCFSIMQPRNVAAQNAKGQSVVTAGVGVSLVGLLFNAVKNTVNSQPGAGITLSSTPVIIGAYDYGVTDKFSMGFAVSYQSFGTTYTNYTYTNSQNVQVTIPSYKDNVTRMNFGVRPLFHLGNNPNLDTYLGARISYTSWSTSTTNPDPYYNTGSTYDFIGASPIKFQTVLGLRYFFGDLVGINMELAIGPSYYLAGGINFRFGATK